MNNLGTPDENSKTPAPHMTSPKGGEIEKSAVERLFTESADNYSNLFTERKSSKNFLFRKRLDIAVEMSRGCSGDFLDCATGSGEVAAAILAKGDFKQAVLLDLSPKMLEIAKASVHKSAPVMASRPVDFICDDVFQFLTTSPEKQHFDLVLCLGLIAHTGRLVELLTGVRKVLSASGGVLLQTTLADHPGTAIHRALTSDRFAARHGYRIAPFTHADIKTACDATGLSIVSSRRYALGFQFADRIWPWMNYCLEKNLEPWSRRHGSEAMYLLRQG